MKKQLTMDDAERLMSIEEVATRMRTPYPVVKKLVDKGYLDALFFKKQIRIPKSFFAEFLQKAKGKDIYKLIKGAETE